MSDMDSGTNRELAEINERLRKIEQHLAQLVELHRQSAHNSRTEFTDARATTPIRPA